MACSNQRNSDGSWDCLLDLSDGTSFAYKSHQVNGVYPEGIGCDPHTGQLYAFDELGQQVPLPLVVNLQTGAITRQSGKPAPPSSLTIVAVK